MLNTPDTNKIKAINVTDKGTTIRVPLDNTNATRIATILMESCRKATVITNSACASFPSMITIDCINTNTMQTSLIKAANYLNGLNCAHWRRECTRQILWITSLCLENNYCCDHVKKEEFDIHPHSLYNLPKLAIDLAQTISKRDLMQNQGNSYRATNIQKQIEKKASRIELALENTDAAARSLHIIDDTCRTTNKLKFELQNIVQPVYENKNMDYATALCIATACQTWTSYLARQVNRCMKGLTPDQHRYDKTWNI